jgi:ubiquinone/menaquinone biosynthesis C-methylase UbiE
MMDFIYNFWENQASKYGVSHEASWGDVYAIDLEINNIASHISEGKSVLDVGCANGFALIKHAQNFKLAESNGIDFSPKMIEMANTALAKTKSNSTIHFSVGDIRCLDFPDAKFDIVYTTRVLINLPTWHEQIKGINECIRVTKPGGKVIFSEAFWEPLVKLNALRTIFGLPSLVEHDFNRYLKKSNLNAYLNSIKTEFEVNDFSSLYYLGSRLIRDLIPESKTFVGYDNPVNKIFHNIEKDFSGGDVGIQQAYIIKKPLS